ncbi:MAG: hypothetical protein A2869_00335 [Candidatus Levybacteria bacterium RIFCSPHIGHO2_01_FULL_40_58]|nr:MAG: hypothetical protein A2869_00335 [Candidatus Levybacteria bacterium RIFCSPHIGHO2_01_FULL_40_58]OGH40085.1 MAG: hypothetical protein A2894_04075 [Candidatus Levybacteria bacterium RIFCSPLOWO2_01_FULL_40_64]
MENNIKLPTTRLPIIPPYALSFYSLVLESDLKENNFIKFLREKAYTMKFTGLDKDYLATSRLISTWIESGLIDEDVRDNKGSWKRFSAKDLLWIKIINKLRWFGLPISSIEKVRQFLLTNEHFVDGEYLFDYAVMLVMTKSPISLIVLPDGEAHLLNQLQLSSARRIDSLHDFIHISFNQIVREVFNKPDLEEKAEAAIALSDDEAKLYMLLREGKYSNIEIVMQNGKIERFEASEDIDTDTKINDLLSSGKYQNINIQQQDGKVVSVKRILKNKV